MSNAKWCDGCASLYPEGLEGAESGVATMTRNIDGRPISQQVSRDFCPNCVGARQETNKPIYRAALDAR